MDDWCVCKRLYSKRKQASPERLASFLSNFSPFFSNSVIMWLQLLKEIFSYLSSLQVIVSQPAYLEGYVY